MPNILKMKLTLAAAAIALSLGFSGEAGAVECQDRTTPLAGWASPVSQFSALQMMTADCIDGGINWTVGDGDRKTFVYGTAYYRRPGGNWTQFSLSGAGTPVNGYYRESAIGFVPFEEDVDVAAYVCEYIGGTWKCGCVDAACAEPFWALQETTFPVTPSPPPSGGGFVSQVAECTGPVIDVNPSTLQSAMDNNANATFRLAPGTYTSNFTLNWRDTTSCHKFTCSVPAIVNGQRNANGCVWTGPMTIWRGANRLIVENQVIMTDQRLSESQAWDYGIRMFYVNQASIRNNWFEGILNHEVATKYSVHYAEVYDNVFNNCLRICIENGQDPNITQQPSMSGEMIIDGNTFNGATNQAIVNRNVVKTTINNNDFINTNVAIYNWPLWKEYYGEQVRIPDVTLPGAGGYSLPLETNVTNNTFTGNNVMYFVSRGLSPANDLIYLKDNTGSFTCGRYNMNAFNSNTANAHSNEVSTLPPNLASGSDACPVR